MEVSIIKEDKDQIEVGIAGETHTLCDALRNELLDSQDTSFASYNLKHPLVNYPVFALKVNKGKPKKSLIDAADSLKKKTKEFRGQLSKLQ